MTTKIFPISLIPTPASFILNENKEKLHFPSLRHQLSPAFQVQHGDSSRAGAKPELEDILSLRVLPESARWKQLYLNLLDEFQRYKYATDALIITSDQALAQKIADSTAHLEIIKEEQEDQLQKYRLKLDQANRERILFQTEIKGIREQLEETSGKLRQKTVLSEALQRQIDEHSMGTSLERHGEESAIAETKRMLTAAEARVAFLQQEVAALSNKNVQLQRKIEQIVHQSSQEVSRLRKSIHGNADSKEKEIFEIQQQQEETIHHLHTQQAYIYDLDKFVNERMEINEHVSNHVQEFAAQLAQETERTLQILEDRLRKTMEEKVKLETSLEKANKVIREKTEEGRRQTVAASRFITHIYQILSIPPRESTLNDETLSATTPTRNNPLFHDDAILSNPDDSDKAHVLDIDIRSQMKKLLKRIVFWSQQHELQKNRLLQRISQLEQCQTEQKNLAAEEIERYRKKCLFFRQVLRKIRAGGHSRTLELILGKPKFPQQSTKTNSQHLGTISEREEENSTPRQPHRPNVSLKHVEQNASSNTFQHRSTELAPNILKNDLKSKEWNSFLKRHEQFVRILDNVQRYTEENGSANV